MLAIRSINIPNRTCKMFLYHLGIHDDNQRMILPNQQASRKNAGLNLLTIVV